MHPASGPGLCQLRGHPPGAGAGLARGRPARPPVIVRQLNGVSDVVSVRPGHLSAASALFALVTVSSLLPHSRGGWPPGSPPSRRCATPRAAARAGSAETSRRAKGVSLLARHGLGQPGPQPGQDGGHRPLPHPWRWCCCTVTVTLTQGFDMDKYVSNFICQRLYRGRRGPVPDRRGRLSTPRRGRCPRTSSTPSTPRGASPRGGKVYGRHLRRAGVSSPRSTTAPPGPTFPDTPEQLDQHGVTSRTGTRRACWPTRAQLYGMEAVHPGPPDGAGGRPVQAQ